MTTNLPTTTCKGLTFWPIPEFSKLHAVFGAEESSYFDRSDLPKVPRQYINKASDLFFSGGTPELGEDVDRAKAINALRAWLCSFAPSHESKEATVAYALWCWAPETKHIREGGAA